MKLPLHDYHVHTIYSGHSEPEMKVADIIRYAEEKGLEEIAFTEHSFDWHLGPAGNIKLIKDEIEKACPLIKVFAGMEICPDLECPGRLKYEDFNKGSIYPVLTGFHSYPGIDKGWHLPLSLTLKEKRKIYSSWLGIMEKLIENPLVDVLAHPGRIIMQNGIVREFKGNILKDFENLFDAAKAHGVAVELNEGLLSRINNEKLKKSYLDVFRMAVEKDIKISIGSDAHAMLSVGRFDNLYSVARELKLKKENFFFAVSKN